MTTLQKTIITASLALLAGAGMYEAKQAQQLRSQNRTLEQQQASLAQQNQHPQNAGDDAPTDLAGLREENARLRANQDELLKLRGEVAALQTQADAAEQRAKKSEEKLAAVLSAASVFKGHEAATINAAKQMDLALRVYAGNHDNQYPTNLVQISDQFGGGFSIGEVELFAFELINPGNGWFDHPNAVALRERVARQAADGSWERIYAFADGSVQKALSNDGNFEAWEKLNTYAPSEQN